jgi:hypothetical protein
MQGAITEDGKVCDMGLYFCRPDTDLFRNMKYTELFAKWDFNYTLPIRFRPGGVLEDEEDSYILQSLACVERCGCIRDSSHKIVSCACHASTSQRERFGT